MFSVGASNTRNNQIYRRLNRQRNSRQRNRTRNQKDVPLFSKKGIITIQNNRTTFNNILKATIEKEENKNTFLYESLHIIFSCLIKTTDEGFYQNKFEHFISIENNTFINQENNKLYVKYMNYFIKTIYFTKAL